MKDILDSFTVDTTESDWAASPTTRMPLFQASNVSQSASAGASTSTTSQPGCSSSATAAAAAAEQMIHEKIDFALQLVGTHAARLVHPRYQLDFNALSLILQEISLAIAEVNRLRVQQIVGSPVQKLTNAYRERMKQVVEFGVGVASRMLLAISDGQMNAKSETPSYDVFLSYPGEEMFLYAPLLYAELEKALSNDTTARKPRIFMDKKNLETGDPSSVNPPDVMLKCILSARVLLFVCTFHSVQKKWPVMEFLCGLARLNQLDDDHIPPVVLDDMPGAVWLVSTLGKKRDPADWINDIEDLYPIVLPPILPVNSKRKGMWVWVQLNCKQK